jgi:glutamate N-acetyltransferase/amino-acid N-acetyltransferase
VLNAISEQKAEHLAKSIISSNLTKTAIFGCDANWGRVLCAMGYSGERFNPDSVDIFFHSDIGTIKVCENGVGLDFNETLAKDILLRPEVEIIADIKEGDSTATCWGCDMTYDYIRINGDYRT